MPSVLDGSGRSACPPRDSERWNQTIDSMTFVSLSKTPLPWRDTPRRRGEAYVHKAQGCLVGRLITEHAFWGRSIDVWRLEGDTGDSPSPRDYAYSLRSPDSSTHIRSSLLPVAPVRKARAAHFSRPLQVPRVLCHVKRPPNMASRPPRAVGHKKLATYGSSRKKHSNLITTQDGPCPVARKSQSPDAHQSTGPSPEAKSLQTSSDRGPTDYREHAGEQQSAKKRKRDHASAQAVKHAKEPSDDTPDATTEASPGAHRVPFHIDNKNAKMARKATVGAEYERAPPAQTPSTPKVEKRAPAGDTLPRGPSSVGHQKTPPASRRPRLIDALTAQRDTSPGPTRSDERLTDKAGDEAGSPMPQMNTHGQNLRSRAADRRGATPTSKKIKLTYSQSRSVLSESRGIEGSSPSNDTGLAGAQTLSSPTQGDHVDENAEDEADLQPAIKSVHELRRSGANNRVADEMDDLLTRIGTPGGSSLTMRRNALCELAQSLPRASFAGQFRDHASRDKVARGIGKEDDVVSGFALAAALVIFLKSGPAPHLVRQLSQEGLGQLLGSLLRVSEDIDSVAKQRTTNLARTTKASVHSVKSTLMQMPIWHGLEPVCFSPRTMGLQLLETVGRCADEPLLQQVTTDLNQDLALVAADCAEAGGTPDVVDYSLTVFALEVLSSAGVGTGAENQGSSEMQLPRNIAAFLGNAMQRWPCHRGELEAATLKLAINTTNTERGAAAFADADLLSLLADRVGSGYERVQNAVGSGPLEGDLYDELILLLGVLINIVEHSPRARASVKDEALDGLVTLWHRNLQSVSEVRGPCHGFPTTPPSMDICMAR